VNGEHFNFITGALILIIYDIIKIYVISKRTAREVRKEKIRWAQKNGNGKQEQNDAIH